MNALAKEFGSTGFRVLAFPCNNFGMQEPGANGEEILNGIKHVRPGGGFVADFDFFKKTDVNGYHEHPLYRFLKSRCGPTDDVFDSRLFYSPLRVSDVRWNFEVFIIDNGGQPLYRYHHRTPTEDIRQDLMTLFDMQATSMETHSDDSSHMDNAKATANDLSESFEDI